MSDDSPALTEPQIPCFKGQAFVPFSVELGGDAVALLTEIGKLMSDGMTQLLNEALTNGTGVGNPTGIVTALAGTYSAVTAATGEPLQQPTFTRCKVRWGPSGRPTPAGLAT